MFSLVLRSLEGVRSFLALALAAALPAPGVALGSAGSVLERLLLRAADGVSSAELEAHERARINALRRE